VSLNNVAIELPRVQPAGWLRKLDPRLKLVWLMWMSTLSVVVDSTAALAALFGVAVVAVLGLRLRPRGWLLIGGLLLLTAWGTLLSQGLFYARQPRTPLFTLIPSVQWGEVELPALQFYREGALYGLKQSLRILAVTLAGLCVCLSTGPERLLAALTRLKVPVVVAYMSVAALRFLPLILVETATIRRARRLRGYGQDRWGRRRRAGWWTALKMEFALLLPVTLSLMRRSESLATSVASRGFDPSQKRTFYPELRLRAGECLLLIVLATTWAGLVATKSLYWIYLAEIYYAPWARGLYDFARRWL